ncbi:MAG: hypothetical protein J0L99_11715 [Chitinophagales bacterium]|nr:hypothetical protein [Chitinophagales bacterium]
MPEYPTHNPAPALSGVAQEWLKALPAELDRTDLYALNDDDFAVKCVRELPDNRQFELSVQAGHSAGEWLNHFYFEARNREKVFGVRTLGVGYPMVCCRLGQHEAAAPLFVWQIQLEPHSQHPDQWSVLRGPGFTVTPNYPFFSLVDSLHGTDLLAQVQSVADSRQINSRLLSDICDQLRQILHLQEEGLPLSVQPCPADAELGAAIVEGRLYWSAVAGLFPAQPRQALAQAPVVAPGLEAEANWAHSFTTLSLDPSQRAALEAIQTQALSVVEGASGSGKTYLISSLIINALSCGKKTLVVSKSINSLRRAQRFLLDKGFGDLSFLLRDTHTDRLMLADMLRAAAEAKNKVDFNEDQFRALLNKAKREHQKLDHAWAALHTPVFGELDFSGTVARFLRANRLQGKELLLSQLHPADFELNREEYDTIVASIYESEPLFRRFPTLTHPLNAIKSEIFTTYEAEQGKSIAAEKAEALLSDATRLHHRYIGVINEYTESLLDYYEQHDGELNVYLKRIHEALEDGVNSYGPDFTKPLSSSEKIYGVFSDRYKAIVALKEKIAEDFEAMRRLYSLRRHFEFDFPAHFDNRNITKIAALTKGFSAALDHWRKRIPAVVREDVRRLNNRSIHSELSQYRETIFDVEAALDAFVERFNETGLFEEHLRHEMLTLPKRQEFLEEVIARLEDTRFYLRDFDDFYIWQKHWLGLTPPAQKAVRALCKVKPSSWVAAFESWYLYHFLQKHFTPELQWDDETLERANIVTRQLREALPAQIITYWQGRKQSALKTLKSENGNAYKTWFGKDNRERSATHRPEDLFREQIHALTETLPVLLVTPQVALDVVQASNMLFDAILVDEAHNIPKEECYHLFDMAKNLVFLGDAKQDMTPFEQDDVLEFCKKVGAATYTLDYQHQDSPEEWVNFNKVAFNTPFKRLPSGRKAQDATVVVNVEGRYDEALGTNEAEARQIIDWLNLIEPTASKTYPMVGIACATVQQRDLIAGQLLKIRQKKLAGHDKIQQLHLNGLGVYQFGELQGQHVDFLLVSMTHGMKDAQGSLSKHLHFWNSQLGFNQLHVLLTRATQKMFIAHSIPPGLHAALASDKNHLGTCVLSHLVTYADHLQHDNPAAAEEQLQKMRELLGYDGFYYPGSMFKDEVDFALRTYYAADELHQNALAAGVRVPLLIRERKSDTPGTVLFFDGVLAPSKLPSYEWEAKLRQHFARHNYRVMPTYTASWWKSPKQEARRLTGKLSVNDER